MEVLSLCVNRGGFRKGRRVAQFIFEWELAVRGTGQDITTEEFAAWWRVGPATPYRRLAEFRELFPELGEHGKPSQLMGPLLATLVGVPATEAELDAVPMEVPT